MLKLFCIDPSVCSLGWAYFEYDKDRGILLEVGGIQHTKHDWIFRLDKAVNELYVLLSKYEPDIVIIEMPAVYHTGDGAVASNSESIMKLSSFVFAVRQMSMDYFHQTMVFLIPVRQWKGQIKKPVTWKRNKQHWNFQSDNHDIQDAVGLGDYWIRKKYKIKDLRNAL